ncbi:hypothetical protein [uncultured Caballeronia sp.]|jgi:hypothetical protein|uniref:hypothetical protein n=1 Tax=uncultured Caballeronia sp. TaxID=1827198 RepID=UPI0015769088
MDNAFAVLIGVIAASVGTLISSAISSWTQTRVAKIGAEKDISVHISKLLDARLVSEAASERAKLEQLHLILSRIAFENSQTCSFIDSASGLELNAFRQRYRDNCIRMDEASAIVDMHYPELYEWLNKIQNQTNMFWGYQEGVLETDNKNNPEGWQMNMSKVLTASHEVNKNVYHVQRQIRDRFHAIKISLKSIDMGTPTG